MTEAHLSTTIIENPEMLKYQQRRQQVDQKNEALGDTADSTTAAPKVASMVNGETLEDIRKVETSGWQFTSITYKAWEYPHNTYGQNFTSLVGHDIQSCRGG